ncbi:MAG: hypothetical protein Q8P93_00405 [bacterium]|nr:hypothetical protein [bacterium]
MPNFESHNTTLDELRNDTGHHLNEDEVCYIQEAGIDLTIYEELFIKLQKGEIDMSEYAQKLLERSEKTEHPIERKIIALYNSKGAAIQLENAKEAGESVLERFKAYIKDLIEKNTSDEAKHFEGFEIDLDDIPLTYAQIWDRIKKGGVSIEEFKAWDAEYGKPVASTPTRKIVSAYLKNIIQIELWREDSKEE